MEELSKEQFLTLKAKGLTFAQIGKLFNLTERQVNYRTKAHWDLDYSKKKYVNESFFKNNTKASNYWAGMLAADGSIEGGRNRISLGLQVGDIGHIEKFKKAVSSSHDICLFMHDSAARIRFNSLEMVEDLKSIFNIVPAKTMTYKMPFFEEDYLMLEFLRGYIDGDGHLEKTNSNRVALHLCSANKEFLQDFKEICELLINRNITQNPTLEVNKKGQVYTIRYTLDDSLDLLNLLYKNSTEATRLDRKYKIASIVLR